MNTKNLGMEIITPENFESVISYLPNPNDILADKKTFFETVDEMLLDPKINSHLRLRKDIVTSFNFVIDKGNADDRVYEFIRDNLTAHLNWDCDVKEFLTAIEYGFSLSEVLWRNENGYWIPDALRNKKASLISFENRVQTVNGIKKNVWIPFMRLQNRELSEPYKFLIYRNNMRNENPYGTSDLLSCYWAWKFKTLGWDFWLRACKKSSVPSIVALFDVNTVIEDEAKKQAKTISDALSKVEGGAGVGLANVKDVKPLNVGAGAVEGHKTLIEICNAEISSALTNQTLATAEANYGSRAQAEVHDTNLVRVAHGDAKALQGIFQTLIDWTVELNFGANAISPKGYFDLENYASYNEIIQAVQNKIPISRESLYTRYGLPRPEDTDDVFIVEIQTPQGLLGLSDDDKNNKKKKTASFLNDEAKRFKELNRFSENAKNKFNTLMSALFKNAFTTHFEKALKENRPPEKKEIESFSIKTIASDDGKKLLEFTQDVLLLSLLLGNEHADRNVELADDNFGIGASFGVPSKDALEYLKSQIPVSKDEYADLKRKVQFRAFTVSKLAEADFVNKAKESLVDGIENSKSFSEIWDEFKRIGSKAGVDISAGYFETVYRTNIQSAYNAGRLIRYKNNAPPAWELLFMEDGNMSEICSSLMNEVGGKAIKSDDPFWSTVGFPPYHYNCRTTFRAVYDYELNEGEVALTVPKEHAPLDNGFGGNPLEKESWWKLTPGMKERAKEYGLKDGIEAMAKKLGVKDFTLEKALKQNTKPLTNEKGKPIFRSEKTKEILDKQKPVDEEVYKKEKEQLEKRGFFVSRSLETDVYLEARGCEGAILAPNTILFHTKLSASGLYEEIIHTYQIEKMNTISSDTPKAIIYKNEIAAKKQLLKNIKKYGITDYEVGIIKKSIKYYEELLKRSKNV